MAKVLITEDYLSDIADAICEKNGLATSYMPRQMAQAILSLSSENHSPIEIRFSQTENQELSASADLFSNNVVSENHTSNFTVGFPKSIRIHASVTPDEDYEAEKPPIEIEELIL